MDNLEIQLNTIHSSTKLYFNQAIKKNSGPPQFYIYIYIYIYIHFKNNGKDNMYHR